LFFYVILWGCQLATNIPHGIFSGVFDVDTVERCLLMFDQLDFEGILNDQRYNVNLINGWYFFKNLPFIGII